ncbi:MAG: Gfo/Idh/MocA family oxidoreductase, partial [Bacteroidales bacterium]|nr:Gfo/Idh/MocA family oxidoreductase [Bacteroidales bacterium]
MEKQTKKMNRREFLGLSALGLASFTILPSWSVNGQKYAPSDRIVFGFIGLGRQGMSDFYAASNCPGVQVVAGCDVDALKRERFMKRVTEWQKKTGWNPRCDTYEFYEEMLDRKDIDVVSIATPDHWHALAAIHACQASKDVYLQKPLTYTISESIALVRAVRANDRVLQVGSQQRSDREFQRAIELVRAGAIGHIESVQVHIGEPPKPFDLPEVPVPPYLNFNAWMGPLTSPNVHYHPDMCPPIDNPEMEEKGPWAVWRNYRETGNGYTGDWGAHHYDITQAALGMDGSGPVEYIPAGYNGTKYCTMKYADGIVVTEQVIENFRKDNPNELGIKFIGT